MQIGLSARDRRTLLFGGSIIGSLLALGRGMPALRSWEETQRTEATNLSSELTAARAAQSDIRALRDSLSAQRRRVADLDSAFVTGETPSAAAAQLASTLEDLADDARVKIGGLQLRADSVAAGPVTEVGVRITGTCDVFGLLALMRSIEGGDVLLAIRDINVSQSDPGAPENKPELLRVDMTVAGLARITPEKSRGR